MLQQGLPSESLLGLFAQSHPYLGTHVEGLGLTLLVHLVVHDCLEHSNDRVHDECHEGTLGTRGRINTSVGVNGGGFNPLRLVVLRDEAPITPKLLGKLIYGSIELLGVISGECLESETMALTIF